MQQQKYSETSGAIVDSKLDIDGEILPVEEDFDQVGDAMNKRLERKLDVYIIPIFGVRVPSKVNRSNADQTVVVSSGIFGPRQFVRGLDDGLITLLTVRGNANVAKPSISDSTGMNGEWLDRSSKRHV
jgi:hypothetical protein